MTTDIWKLQDAKARFSEVVRRARAGDPQHVTLHGEEAVVIVDPKRFDISPKVEAKAPELSQPKAPQAPQTKASVTPPAKTPEIPAPKRPETPVPRAAAIAKPVAPLPKVEKAPEPVPVPTPDAAALDLIAELEMELRRLKEPLPEPPRRRFGDDGK